MQFTRSSRHPGRVFTGKTGVFIPEGEARNLEDFVLHVAQSDFIDKSAADEVVDALGKLPLLAFHLFKKRFIELLLRTMFTENYLIIQMIYSGINTYYELYMPGLPPEELSKNDDVIKLVLSHAQLYRHSDSPIPIICYSLVHSSPKYFHDHFKSCSHILSYDSATLYRPELTENYLFFHQIMLSLPNCQCFSRFITDAIKFLLAAKDPSMGIGQLRFLDLCFRRSNDIAWIENLDELVKYLLKVLTVSTTDKFYAYSCLLLLTLCANSPVDSVKKHTTSIVLNNKKFCRFIKSEISKGEDSMLSPLVICIAISTNRLSDTSFITLEAISEVIMFGLDYDISVLFLQLRESVPGLVYLSLEEFDCFIYLSQALRNILQTFGVSHLNSDPKCIEKYDARISVLHECIQSTPSNSAPYHRIRRAQADTIIELSEILKILLGKILKEQKLIVVSRFLLGLKWQNSSKMDNFKRFVALVTEVFVTGSDDAFKRRTCSVKGIEMGSPLQSSSVQFSSRTCYSFGDDITVANLH